MAWILEPMHSAKRSRPEVQRAVVLLTGATPVTPQPGCPHAPAPLRHLPAPPRDHRRADAHEHHLPTADAHGAARPPQPRPPQDIAHRILGSAWWAGFTFNGITAYGDVHDSLIGSGELSDGERDALLELCRQRLDAFREHQRALEVDHLIPRNQGGSDAVTNLQALCFRCNAGKRDGCLPTQEGAPTSAACRPATATAKQAVCPARWRAAAGCCWRTSWRSASPMPIP